MTVNESTFDHDYTDITGVHYSAGGPATFTNCTFSNDTATSGGGAVNFNNQTNPLLTIIDCTFFNDSTSGSGGAIINTATLTLTDSTISGNSAAGSGGGLFNDGGTVTLSNTIVAGNTASSSAPDVYETVTSAGHNLIGKTNGSTGWVASDLTGTVADPLNPLLAPPGNYGGPTETMALLPGSPAIGKGVAVSGVTTDQRGLIRGTTVDIGAFQTSLVVESTSATVVTTAAGLTLPGAVGLANQFAGSAISFDPAVFATEKTITLTGSQLELSDTVLTTSITGPAAGVIVSGGGTSRVFQVDSGVTASFSGLTVSGGSVNGNGGGLYNAGTTMLTNCTVSGNSAGIDEGGGVFNRGTITLTNSTLSGNSAGFGGGMETYNGTTTLTNCTVTSNSVSNNGGGLDNFGTRTTTLTNCTVSSNTASQGGGLSDFGPHTLMVTNCTISGNIGSGIYVGGNSNTIGGTTACAGNLISGNTGVGIDLSGSANVVLGNRIGTNAAGTAALANSGDGIDVFASNNTIGGTASGAGNVISGNSGDGIQITGTGVTGNVVLGNLIGTNAAGTGAVANVGLAGIMIYDSNGNTIGGTAAGADNAISGNSGNGIQLNPDNVTSPFANDNLIAGNFIGVNAAGTAIGNGGDGIFAFDATGNTIGGTVAGGGTPSRATNFSA